MMQLVLMPTTLCNLNCVHCMVDKTTAKSIPLDLVESVLKQAKDLGIREVCLTGGGEPTMYPHLEELVESIVHYGLRFNLVTNGLRFRDRLLP
ncbi:MAG: radical SAM protein, partial [Candidatus Nezhaarchaeota archaeon]|nr:radical SAM protein [Candidatus Nezhaarchaeota archaeon]